MLGYDLVPGPGGSKLMVNKTESDRVRDIFDVYLAERSLLRASDILNDRGWTTKRWVAKNGEPQGGRRFDKAVLHKLLTNPVYIGKVRHHDDLYDREHEAIVDEDVFREVGELLMSNSAKRGRSPCNKHGAMLKGLVVCMACGCAMGHHFATSKNAQGGSKRYRYYVCGQAAALKLASSGTAFDTLRDEIRDAAGIAVETAEQMDAGIGGAFRKLLSAVEGIAIAIGEAIEGPVRKVADALARVAGYITRLVTQNRELVATIAKVTAIVLGVGVALVIAGTAIIGIGAVLGSLAAIASAAGTAIGVIGAVLGALVSPIGLVIAGVAALGVATLYYTGAGGEAIAWLSERFGELRAFVGKVAGGIADALAAGDIQLAAQILWRGLQVAWKRGVAALNEVWLGARNFFITTAQKMWYGALAVAQTVFHALEIAWIETTSFLSKTWTRFTSGFQKVWQSASSFVAKRMLEIQGLFDSGLDVEAAKRAVDDQLDAKLSEIDANTRRDLAGRESRRQRERDDASDLNEATLAEIGRRFEDAQDALRSGTDADIAETQRKLDEARAKLDEAIAEARRRREEQDESGVDPAGNVPRDLIGRLQEGLAGLGAAIERGVAVRGTFNALAVQSLAAGDDTAERTAKASEQTAKNTRRLADSAQSGGLSFT